MTKIFKDEADHVKLMLLADYFDKLDKLAGVTGKTEVQDDLRRIARDLRAQSQPTDFPKQPKFKVGDLVIFRDEFAHNPIEKVSTIGRIELVNIFEGRSMFIRTGKGEKEPKSLKGKITYNIGGYSLVMDENKLRKYTK